MKQTIRSLPEKEGMRLLCFDPEGISSQLQTALGEWAEGTFWSRTVEETVEYCSLKTGGPDLVILIEREGGESAYRGILGSLGSFQKRYNTLYLYERNLLYPMIPQEWKISAFPLLPRELLQINLEHFIYSVRLRRALLRSHQEQKSLEEKIAKIGELYHKEQREMRHRMEKKDLWFASMVHELRTPVNGIIGMTYLLREASLGEKERDYLSKIQHSGEILRNLVNDLLDFSKLESGKLEIEHEMFDLNEVLEQVASVVGVKVQEKGLELIFDIDHFVPARIAGDEMRLSQILINLLNNAVKFTEKGEVTLRITCPRRKENKLLLLFEVIDTGIGMTPEQQKKIFGAFAQSDASISKKYGGTGLGLMIAKQLVEKMGGRIGVESKPGRGSRFYFTLPTERNDRRSYRLPSKDLMYKKVLILDSNAHVSGALARMLRYFHYGVVQVQEREELREALEDRFDIVIIDESMVSSSLQECRDRLPDAQYVLLRPAFSTSLSDSPKWIEKFSSVLTKPATQQRVFELILNLYGAKEREESKEWEELGEKLRKYEGMNVLIADDNTINQAVMMGLVSKAGLQGVLASNGKEVLDRLEREDIDVVLMDLHMPVMDGIEATKRIRSDRRYDKIPVVALTGDDMDPKKIREMGMQAYLTKPIQVRRFYTTLMKLFEEYGKTSPQKNYYMQQYGFDVVRGLERAGGNPRLYCTMVEEFLRTALQLCKEAETQLMWNNLAEARRLVNIITMSAANVMAEEIDRKSSELYRVLLQGNTERGKALCSELAKEIFQARSKVRDAILLQRRDEKKEQGKQEGNKSLLEQKMNDLRLAVQERRPYHCAKILDELSEYWWDLQTESKLAKMREYLENNRFDDLEILILDGGVNDALELK